MAKKQAGKGSTRKGAKKASPKPSAHRIVTFKPNGPESVEVAPEPGVVDLGPIILPDAEGALSALRGLAELNDRAIQAKQRYEDAKEKAKNLKAKWDDLAAEVQSKLRAATHGSDLPLFPEQAEEDLAAMQAAGSASDPVDVPADEIPW